MRKLVITLFCIALLIPSRGNTLGLGEIELHSALNQELKAEIALLSVGKESAETIIVKLASKADFVRAGIDRPFILNDLKFVVLVKNGQPYVSVTSKKTIREPYLSFLLDIDWPRGHLLREFTMLLDPPVFMQASPQGEPLKAVAAPQAKNTVEDANQQFNRPGYEESSNTNSQASAQAATTTPESTQFQPQQTVAQPAVQTTTRPVARYQAAANGYRVQKNDTAWKIAERLRSDTSVSIEQMMMALLRRNPEAFISDNINGVKRGYILRMPDEQEINELGKQTALLQVKEQYALWREYRQGLSAKRNANRIARDGVADPASTTAVKGQLTIATAAEGEASEGATSGRQNPDASLKQLRQDLAATSEELESGKLENQELKERIQSLKTRMKKMEKLLNLKDGDLANLQSDLSPDAAAPADDTMAAETAAEVSPAAVDMTSDTAMDSTESAQMADNAAIDESADAMPVDGAMDAPMDAISSTQADEEAVFKDQMSAPITTNEAQPAAIPPAESVEVGELDQNDIIEELLSDPANLPILAGVPAIVIILIAFLLIRRRKAKNEAAPVTELPETGDFNFDDVADIDLTDDGTEFDVDGEEDLEAQLESFAEESEQALDEEDVISLDDGQPSEDEIPKDDVLAEADVYLAYGIYQQAEELLKAAITSNPERDDYKVKLIETHFAAKDEASFVSLAEQLQPQFDPESAEWQRIVSMGREMDATNEMFRNAGELKGFDVDDLIPEKPETDFDLGDAAADFDLGDSIDDEFGHGLDDESLDDDIDASAAMPADGLDLGGLDAGGDSFALDDDGMDELDKELAEAGVDDEIDLGEIDVSTAETEEVDDLDDGFSLDFEMADLGLDESSAEVSLEETEEVATAMEPEEIDMSFDLSGELEDDLDALAEEPATDTGSDMDLGDMPDKLEPEAEYVNDVDLDMGEIDLDGIDLAADDTDDISLDLDDAGTDDISLEFDDDDKTVLRPVLEEDDEAIDISTLPEDLDEVNTKLDLARAYIDMGDSDGAASILREVIEEAEGDQKQSAEELLKNIA